MMHLACLGLGLSLVVDPRGALLQEPGSQSGQGVPQCG